MKPLATANQTAVTEGNNVFAVALYGRLRHQSGNLFFSPESISTALAMAYAGARGSTASEMAKTLDFTLPPDKLHPAMGALLRDLNATHGGYQLSVANALWAQQGYPFLDEFLSLLKTDYGAGLNQVNFKGATEAARLTINQWVEQKTQDKIKDLLQPGALRSTHGWCSPMQSTSKVTGRRNSTRRRPGTRISIYPRHRRRRRH